MGKRASLASGPDEDRVGASMAAGGSLPADGRGTEASTGASDAAGAGGAQEARVKVCREGEEAQRAALLEQAEDAAARLKELIAKLGVVGVTPLAETEPQMVVLEARLAPAARYLTTAGEDLLFAAIQSDSAREQLLRAEAHLSFAQLHMAAAQKFQTPAEEVKAPSGTPVIPAGAQLVKALTWARRLEVTASDPQARCQRQWVREALCRTTCVSYVALEACGVATQTSWNPQECGTYRDLLSREEGRLEEAFKYMMPDELPDPMVVAAEVSLEDARDNVTMAQTWMAVRRYEEEKRSAAPEGPPEPPDGGVPAETARRLWAQRALQQTSYVSHMAREIRDNSTKADWTTWAYHEYRRLLDIETMAVCRIYAGVKLADLPVREGEEAREWLADMQREVEYARGHISTRIREMRECGEFPYPSGGRYSHYLLKRSARAARFCRAKATGVKSCRRVRDAVASRTPGTMVRLPGSEPGEVGHGGLQDVGREAAARGAFKKGLTGAARRQVWRHAAIIAWLRSAGAPTSRARLMQGAKRGERLRGASETDLADSTSESDASDPGGCRGF
jgi:hypothetical protein